MLSMTEEAGGLIWLTTDFSIGIMQRKSNALFFASSGKVVQNYFPMFQLTNL